MSQQSNNSPIIVIPGGGSGPISIEDRLLDLTPNVVAITGVTDNGGHSKYIRSVLGCLPPGDATQRIAVRIREPNSRALFTIRFTEQDNKERPANSLLAGAEKLTGSHSEAIKLVMKTLNQEIIRGSVLPISNNDFQLRAILAEGRVLIGEQLLDELTAEDPQITHLDFVTEDLANKGTFHPFSPQILPEVVDTIKRADAIVFPPGSWEGSIKAVTEVPGFYDAVRESNARIFWFCNAVDFPNTKASQYLKEIVEKIGREVDEAIINKPDHEIPDSYRKIGREAVIADISECEKYAHRIHHLPVTKVDQISGKPTIRHNGNIAAEIIISGLRDHQLYTLPFSQKLVQAA